MPPPLKPGEKPIFAQPDHEYYKQFELPVLAPDEKPDLRVYDEVEELPAGSTLENPRHARIAVLHCQGKTNNEICAALGYSQSRISTLLHSPGMVAEIQRIRSHAHADAISELKALDYESVAKLKEHLRAPNEKLSEQVQTAKWVLEKNHGKAKQEVTHESSTLSAFTDLLRKMQATGEPLQPVIEAEFSEVPEGGGVSQLQAPDPDKFGKWLDSELE